MNLRKRRSLIFECDWNYTELSWKSHWPLRRSIDRALLEAEKISRHILVNPSRLSSQWFPSFRKDDFEYIKYSNAAKNVYYSVNSKVKSSNSLFFLSRSCLTYNKEFVFISFVSRCLKIGIFLYVINRSCYPCACTFDSHFSLLNRLKIQSTTFT